MAQGEPRIERVALSEVRRWAKNPKKHRPEIGASIARFGFVAPLVVDERTGELVEGHGRLEVLKKMRDAGNAPPARIGTEGADWQVPVLRGLAFESDDEAAAYAVAANRLVELGGWDEVGLGAMLKELAEGPGLEGLGWNEAELDRALAKATAPAEGFDPAGETPQYAAGAVRPLAFYFEGEEYAMVLGKLEKVMATAKVEDHTGAFLWLLGMYEQRHLG